MPKEQKEGCIFCRIVKGEIPCQKVYEDNEILSFLDIGPVNPGHVLVVPKKHFATLLDLPDTLSAPMLAICKKIAVAQIKALGSQGFNLGINNFPASGQVIPHVHFHVMPRYPNDGLKLWPNKKYEKQSEAEEIAKKLRENLK